MNMLTPSTPLGTLGLTSGDHWVRFHVEGDAISFVLAASLPKPAATLKQRTGFVQKWGGTLKKLDDTGDAWLTHINDKHLR